MVNLSAYRDTKTEIARDHYEVQRETTVEAAWKGIPLSTTQVGPNRSPQSMEEWRMGTCQLFLTPLFWRVRFLSTFSILRDALVPQGDIVVPQECATAFIKKTNLKKRGRWPSCRAEDCSTAAAVVIPSPLSCSPAGHRHLPSIWNKFNS